MTLLEKINHLNLKPRNAPDGVKVSTFGEWLRRLRAGKGIGEIPTALLTLYCDGRINGLKLGSAENFPGQSPIPSIVAPEIQQLAEMRSFFEEAAIKSAAMPPKRIELQKFSANTLDQPMTRKLKVDKSGQHWVLYCTNNKYRLPVEKEDFIIALEEGEFTINDFKI